MDLNKLVGHTPGPWKWYNGCSWWRLGKADDQSEHDAVIRPFTAKDGQPDLSCRDSDRALIERAPDLLELARLGVRLAEHIEHIGSEDADTIKLARALREKAGEK